MPPSATASEADKWQMVGIVDRATGEPLTEDISDTKKEELQGYLEENVLADATAYSDQLRRYDDVPLPHDVVQ